MRSNLRVLGFADLRTCKVKLCHLWAVYLMPLILYLLLYKMGIIKVLEIIIITGELKIDFMQSHF